ncbi:hypothetical protein J2T10_002751 [Paenarthrobacter nicotinovorans]|uniref:HTH iclR-type domain-containing protein n=2 Tax=Paenarthrobacter nicotinovorans TaxID=29320 RepID=A0ABT9TPD1_PAENI|nr:hypothetical protein [Paenarthrobacter nicotinovorans]
MMKSPHRKLSRLLASSIRWPEALPTGLVTRFLPRSARNRGTDTMHRTRKERVAFPCRTRVRRKDKMQHVQAVGSAFALLKHIASLGGNATLSQISEDLGVSAASTHRRLRTLVHLGYARQLHNRSYALGFGLIRLGEVATGQHISAMQPILASAASQLGETVTLAMLEGDMINHTLQAQSPHGLRSTAELGISSYAHETPPVKCSWPSSRAIRSDEPWPGQTRQTV